MNQSESISRKLKIRIAALSSVALAAMLFFAFAVTSYLGQFSEALVEENSNYLSEIAEHIGANMLAVVQDYNKALEMVSSSLPEAQDEAARLRRMTELEEKFGFDYVGYADFSGEMQSTLASEEKNIGTEDYFLRAAMGESVIQYTPRKIYNDRAVSGLLFAAPAYDVRVEGGQPTGVLVAMLDMKNFGKNIKISSFGGQGYTNIIDKTGEIILHTKQMDYSNLYMALGNIEFMEGYSLEKIISDLSTQKAGFAIYSDFGVEKYMYYKYLGIDSWSVVTIIEKNVITAKTTKLTAELTVIGIAIIVLFPALLLFAVLSFGISNSRRQAADAKTAFLANMSHEIRTPMNAIVGISEILLRENLSGKQKNYVLSIVNAGNGLLAIINDILDISKIESGKFTIVDEEYELESLIYDIITIVAIRIGEKPIEFLVDLDPALPKYVTGDMIRVKQVLLNIIGNAVKFTETGYIKFSIHAVMADGKLELTMPIEDTGMGIQKKDLDHLFVSFNQVDTHKNHAIEGTGLGLVISKRLCQMMGGDITVTSEYGKGSTFTVKVTQTITRPEKLLHIPKVENFRLLLLERSEILRNYYKGCLLRMHLEYDICGDYESFVERLAQGGYTHAFGRFEDLNRLRAEDRLPGGTSFVVLLGLREQARMEDYKMTLIVPLFTLQLAVALSDHKGRPYLLKRGGIDILTIQPMPFVKILLVDDNEVNLQVAMGLMNPYHMQVDCATSGKKAIRMIEQADYDIVFMDHMMPEMDGVEATRLIRALPDEKKRSVTIAALTANVTSDAKALFMESGFDDFLSKPIETVKLNVLLKKWLKELNEERAEADPQRAREFQQKLREQESHSVVKSIVDDFEGCAYVDFAAGVENLGGHEIYCGILATYCRTSRSKRELLPQLLENDLKAFTVEIHGLKGASAGVSANLVARSAAELEAMAKAGRRDEIAAELPEFLEALHKTLKEIEKFTGRFEPGRAAPQTSPKQEPQCGRLPDEAIHSLREAFLDFDTERLRGLLAEQGGFSYEQRETRLLSKLNDCYENYNFDRPIELLANYELEISQEEKAAE